MPAGTIVAESLTKVFRTVARKPGVAGAFKSIVWPEHIPKAAVDQVSLRVEAGELLALLTWEAHVTVEAVPAAVDVPGMRLTREDGVRLSFVPLPVLMAAKTSRRGRRCGG